MTDGSQALLSTPLTKWHQSQSARLVEFAGYQMPIQYSSIVAEHTATRTGAGLFDISHMARLRFEGPGCAQLLDHLCTRRVVDLQPGQVRYSLLCNAEGGILDDVLVSHLESPSGRLFYLMVVNASNHTKIVRWLKPHLAEFPELSFADVTEATAMIALQGPRSAAILSKLFPKKAAPIESLRYYRSLLVTEPMGKPVIISRTGYTGEDGYELVVRSEDAQRFWENLMLAGRDLGISPVGLGARDTLRLEAGMPLYGHELSEQVDPLTAGLSFAVTLDNRSFIGSEALQSIRSAGCKVTRVGLKLAGRRAAREGAKLLDADHRSVGEVTSGTFSPTLQCPISMAYIDRELATTGTLVTVDIRGSTVEAQVVDLPFYNSPKT